MRSKAPRLSAPWCAAFIALVVLPAAAAKAEPSESRPSNFGTVVENGIYRGAQPASGDFARLRELGVKTILKLNTSRLAAETRQAEAAGIRLIHVPFDPKTIGTRPTCEKVAKALTVLADESNWPVYVHCSKGRDRAGFLVGLYRQRVQGWTWPMVDRELAEYGHGARLRRSYPQITGELAAGVPTCRDTLPDDTNR